MKIDFFERYGEVRTHVQAPASPVEPAKIRDTFSRLLGDISPNPSKSPNIATAETELLAPLADDAFDIRASYKFPTPGLLTPELPRIGVPEPELQPEQESVKTPTIVEVSRHAQQSTELFVKPLAEREAQVKDIVSAAGAEHGLDPALGVAVARAESSFNPNAISTDGHFSKGLFQLLDTTAQSVISRDKLDVDYSPFEPEQNVDLGMRYLRYLHDIFGKDSKLPNDLSTRGAANSASLEKLAVAAFNAGEGRVASAQARAEQRGADASEYEQIAQYLPKSTQEYVQRVMQYRGEYGEEE
ncbi:MAG: transglycosylase SLT domain-containing protein [Bdellovibrionales bacterium]|nr:transglycosylase SLT domain-containing protein [Bdellovibrionales bacterium]